MEGKEGRSLGIGRGREGRSLGSGREGRSLGSGREGKEGVYVVVGVGEDGCSCDKYLNQIHKYSGNILNFQLQVGILFSNS